MSYYILTCGKVRTSVCSQSAVAQCGFNIGVCVCSTCSNDLTRIIFNTTTNTSHVTEVDSS